MGSVEGYRKIGETSFECLATFYHQTTKTKLRNYLLGGVRSWGASKVDININTSTLNDEIVADRISMIPAGLFKKGGEAGGPVAAGGPVEGSSAETSTYSRPVTDIPPAYRLLKENLEEVKIPVLTTDMEKIEGEALEIPNVIITYLKPGQKIDLVVTYDTGTGLENYRYSSVNSAVYFRESKDLNAPLRLKVDCVEGVDPVDVYNLVVGFLNQN
jgi:hypothetical protein